MDAKLLPRCYSGFVIRLDKSANKLACLVLVSTGLLMPLPTLPEETNQDVLVDAMADLPSSAELEATGAIIGRVIIEKQNVFDTSKPGENKSIFRLANRWHIITRDSVIQQQLLFRTGDFFSQRLLEESERLLRQNNYLYDAEITPIHYADGVVDVRVWTRDLWTLMPGLSVSRTGGENRTRVELSEQNLLGLGVKLRVTYKEDVDRESTSFEYFNRNLGRSWVSAFFKYSDNSDGGTTQFNVTRPFYALDTRWSAGATYFDDEREESFYDLGNEAAEYKSESEIHNAFWGWSTGLKDGWARRWTTGIVYDDRDFSAVPNGQLPSLVPADRRLVYPFLGFELLEDNFQKASNRDQIERTEDFFFGTKLAASLGWAAESFGSDRDAFIYSLSASKGYGSILRKALLLSAGASGRVEHGDSANTQIGASASYYNQITEKRLFFMTLDASWGNDLDLDNLVDLGGDTGLRGYPLRYQTGDSRILLTVEERYFTDWYPFRLFRVGGAVFADIGRTWGDNPVGGPPLGWLKDVGVGLRLGPTRSSGRDIVHIDIAFPLDGDPSIDSVQFLIESKKSF
jgi:outer membrane protein assembly factor BamA